jgi:hypothetical protein
MNVPKNLNGLPWGASDQLQRAMELSRSSTDLLRDELARLELTSRIADSFFKQDLTIQAAVAESRRTRILAAAFSREQAATQATAETFLRSQASMLSAAREFSASTSVPPDMQRWISDLSGGQSLQKAVEIARQWREPFEELRRIATQFSGSLNSSSTLQMLTALKASPVQLELLAAIASDVRPVPPSEARAEVAETARSIAEQASMQLTLQDAVDQILRGIGSIKDTRFQRLVWTVLVQAIFALAVLALTPIADVYIKEWLMEKRQGASKKVKEQTVAAVGNSQLLAEHRFVSAKTLNVGVHPRARTEYVGQLHFGQAVRVIERRNDFTQISWTSEDGASSIQGWVYSRYLKRFE